MGPMPPPPVPNAAGTCGGGKSAHKKGSQAALAGTAGQLKRSMRVLLVEPDDREREALRSVLEDSCKYTVTAVATCLEAADLLLGRSSHEMQRSTEGQGQREQDTEVRPHRPRPLERRHAPRRPAFSPCTPLRS